MRIPMIYLEVNKNFLIDLLVGNTVLSRKRNSTGNSKKVVKKD